MKLVMSTHNIATIKEERLEQAMILKVLFVVINLVGRNDDTIDSRMDRKRSLIIL